MKRRDGERVGGGAIQTIVRSPPIPQHFIANLSHLGTARQAYVFTTAIRCTEIYYRTDLQLMR